MSLREYRRQGVEESIQGVRIRDPFRWLEHPDLSATREWLQLQKQLCDRYFSSCEQLAAICARVRSYVDVERIDQPSKAGHRYFYRHRRPGQAQSCIEFREEGSESEHVIVDPSVAGTFASARILRVSDDGALLAYELRQGGEDKAVINVVDVVSGELRASPLPTGMVRGFAFLPGTKGFCYCLDRVPPEPDHTICMRLFHEPVKDLVVFRVARSRGSRLVMTADQARLGAILTWWNGNTFEKDFWVAENGKLLCWGPVLRNTTLLQPFLGAGRIFALSTQGSVNGRIVELRENGSELRTVIPEQRGVIRQIAIIGERAFATYDGDSGSCIRCWQIGGNERAAIVCPSGVTVRLLPGVIGDEGILFYTYESFGEPPAIFEYDPGTGRSLSWQSAATDRRSFAVSARSLTYKSFDGTDIPITLVCRKQEKGVSAAIMTTYGGFGIASTPRFSILVAIMLELGVTFALPHVRGGGEFGHTWHEAGRRRNRHVAIEDFTFAAKWLHDQGISNPQTTGIFGGSNSGLLIASAITHRPEWFRAAICIAPLTDMVRYEKFDDAAKWRREYGTICDPGDFEELYGHSPYHRVRDGVSYPSVLFVSGDRDERCNPAHARKMAARLQDVSLRMNPALLDYDERRGHAPSLPLETRIEALSRRIAFLCRELGVPFAESGGCDVASV